jgi:O-antigen/teichoic acid export membrane protein
MISLIRKRFFRHTLIYVTFAFLNKGLSFMLVPLFTRYLTPEGYGIYALFLTAVLISEPLMTFCVHDAIGNVYYDRSRFDILDYVSTSLLFCTCTFLLQLILIGSLAFFRFDGFKFNPFFMAVPIVAFSYPMMGALGWMWQMKEKPVSFGCFHLFFMFSQLSLQIFVTVILKKGWQGVLFVQGALAIVTILLALFLLRVNGWLGARFDMKCLRFGLKFGLAYMPHTLAWKLNDSVGRLFVNRMYNLSDTGIYSAGQKLGAIVNVFSQSFNNAYRPWLLKKLSDGSSRHRRKIFLSAVLAFAATALFAGGGSACMYLFSGFVLGRGFAGSIVYVFWSAAAYALNGIYGSVSIFIYQTGKSWIMSMLTAVAVLSNALLTWVFIRKFGMIGAAYAPVLAWGMTLALAVAVTVSLWKNKPPFGWEALRHNKDLGAPPQTPQGDQSH